MPIFEYKCEKCNKVVDKLVKRSEEHEQQYCDCSDDVKLIRTDHLFSTGLQFKGRWFKNGGY